MSDKIRKPANDRQNDNKTRSDNSTTDDTETGSPYHRVTKTANTGSKQNEPETDRCPECDGKIVGADSEATRYCIDCGIVIESDKIDHGPEWRSLNSQDKNKKERVGAPVTNTRHDRGISTEIGYKNESTDSYGSTLSSKQRESIRRIRRADKWNKCDGKDRSLIAGLTELKRMATSLGIGDELQERASRQFRLFSSNDMLNGRSLESMATAALYVVGRQSGTPYTISEFKTVSRVERKKISSAIRYAIKKLNLEVPPPSPRDYVDRYISNINSQIEDRNSGNDEHRITIDSHTQQLIYRTIDWTTENISGNHPATIAGGAIYYAVQTQPHCNVTRKMIADACEVTSVSITKMYRHLCETPDSPKELIFKNRNQDE